jgi:hypothetical protein
VRNLQSYCYKLTNHKLQLKLSASKKIRPTVPKITRDLLVNNIKKELSIFSIKRYLMYFEVDIQGINDKSDLVSLLSTRFECSFNEGKVKEIFKNLEIKTDQCENDNDETLIQFLSKHNLMPTIQVNNSIRP